MKINFYLKIIVFLFFASLISAQSDYRVTQEFKSRQRSFEIAIEYAKTHDELNNIKKEINEFKNEFKGNKELLNTALYPNNFESSFTNLDKKIEYTSKRLNEIKVLAAKVSQIGSDYSKISEQLKKLTSEVNSLRNTNAVLMSELKAFQSGYGGSKESIDSLKNIIAQLKHGNSKRDTLISEIMDNIFMTAEHKIESLDDAEKKGIQTQIRSTSLIDNIANLINDNIEFLDASLLKSDDLAALNEEFNDFDQRWSHFGPKLFDIYSSDKESQDKLLMIDSLISNWDSSIDLSIWKSIQNIFNSHNINLQSFNNGLEFEEVVTNYINAQINNDSEQIEVQKDQDYIFFAERVWNDIIKAEWVPLLTSNDLLSSDQVLKIDQMLLEWRDKSSGSKSYFIYGIILLLAIIIIVSVIFIQRKNKANDETATTILEESSSINKSEISETEEFVDDE